MYKYFSECNDDIDMYKDETIYPVLFEVEKVSKSLYTDLYSIFFNDLLPRIDKYKEEIDELDGNIEELELDLDNLQDIIDDLEVEVKNKNNK